MAIAQDVEDSGEEAAGQPLLQDEGRPWMVYFSTLVAVSGSYEFGTCVSNPQLTLSQVFFLWLIVTWPLFQAGYSSPTQSAIIHDLHLSLAEV